MLQIIYNQDLKNVTKVVLGLSFSWSINVMAKLHWRQNLEKGGQSKFQFIYYYFIRILGRFRSIKLLSHSISIACLICMICIFLSLLSEWFILGKEFEVCCFLFFKWTNVRDFLALFDEYLNNFFRKWRQIWQAISLIITSDYNIRIFCFMRMLRLQTIQNYLFLIRADLYLYVNPIL